VYKRSLVSFASLFIFWIVISAAVDMQHIIIGIIISLFSVWFWKNLNQRLPSVLYPREILLFGRCMIMLIGNIIKSNIDVIKILLSPKIPTVSIFLELEPDIESEWGAALLATCITITPGTVTIDYDPDTKIFTVHALTCETGADLYYWSLITEIKKLETLVQRRKTHVVDNDRIHDSDSINSIEGNNRTHRN
jgi:multicomponent Na+:H+ antiporter subunit E